MDAAGNCVDCAPDVVGFAGGPGDPGAAMTTAPACPETVDPYGNNIARVPESTRTYDSAVYAHALLASGDAQHLQPELLRFADFANYYAYYPTYDPNVPDANGSVDLVLDPTSKAGVVIGRISAPPPGARKPLGMLLVLDTSPSARHGSKRAVEIAAAEAMLAQLTVAGDDAIVRTWSAGGLATLSNGASALLQAAEDPASGALPLDSGNNLGAMLEDALSETDKLMVDPDARKHVVVFTDGGASAGDIDELLASYQMKGVTLDVVLVASATDLSAGYNGPLLETLSQAGGARLLLTDLAPQGNAGYADVQRLVTSRFEEVFGRAFDSLRVTLSIPGTLLPVTVDLQANVFDEPTSDMAGSSTLRDVSIGAGRMVTFREPVLTDPAAIQEIFSGCGERQLVATFATNYGLGDEKTLVEQRAMSSFAEADAAGLYDAALTAFVGALRSHGKSTPTAQTEIAKAIQQCSALGSTDACANLYDMQSQLGVLGTPN